MNLLSFHCAYTGCKLSFIGNTSMLLGANSCSLRGQIHAACAARFMQPARPDSCSLRGQQQEIPFQN
ncbi:MAG: hypothetical protein AUH37_00120 [Candidatus Nitrososphaera sp. 13_1_40CM_48_12]|nr:MAG: hypothetical protein AUH37_00120 [Candidatus Nitrososphaera sp. 13_1_40CM_48_12]